MSKQTGFTRAQKALIAARDLDCVIHTGNVRDTSIVGYCHGGLTHHHIKGRGHGGVKSRNRVANGLLICSSANSALTSDSDFMAYAYQLGWLLRSDYQIGRTLTLIRRLDRMVYLNDAGDYLDHDWNIITERKAA